MMAQAQQMMANMTPEQRQNMENMARNMPADQQENMRRMAMQMGMGGAPPPPAPAASSRATSYQFNAATMLKNEGNALHKGGRHREAIAKYEKAQENLEGMTTSDARSLRDACMLNKAMCLLKLEDWKPCISICTKVLTGARQIPTSTSQCCGSVH